VNWSSNRCPWSTHVDVLASQRGQPPAFDREVSKQRNTVERVIGRLKR